MAKNIDKRQWEHIKKLYVFEGKDKKYLATLFKVSVRTISRRIDKEGWKPRAKANFDKVTVVESFEGVEKLVVEPQSSKMSTLVLNRYAKAKETLDKSTDLYEAQIRFNVVKCVAILTEKLGENDENGENLDMLKSLVKLFGTDYITMNTKQNLRVNAQVKIDKAKITEQVMQMTEMNKQKESEQLTDSVELPMIAIPVSRPLER